MDTLELCELQIELAAAKAEIERLRQANDELCDRVRQQSETINKAKDITPFIRPSFRRVLALARAACLDLCKVNGDGWLLSMGSTVRKFKSLLQIWDILCLESWNLSDLFGDFLVAKPRVQKAVPNFSQVWNGFRIDVYGDLILDDSLSQAQNCFETWNSAVGGFP
ncbi:MULTISPECIES: hypothetical protein [unclassified Microcoleus]|uniref:hypothetical protein n=1 Tax=unclassified Microcoleus TaxID=2642155 RepID=UPI002FD3F9AC